VGAAGEETAMSGDSDETGERLYLAIFEHVAAKSDYLQPKDHNQMLPEAVILATVGSVIGAVLHGIMEGFLDKVGEVLAEKIGGLLKKLRAGKKKPDELAAIVAEAAPVLKEAPTNWDQITAFVALELTRQGMTFPVSQELARAIVASLRRELAGPS
jgi:phage-related minor tail protein